MMTYEDVVGDDDDAVVVVVVAAAAADDDVDSNVGYGSNNKNKNSHFIISVYMVRPIFLRWFQ